MRVQSFRDLTVWQRSVEMVAATYQLMQRLPLDERDALVQQLRRASTSVPANIAEGHARAHRKEFLHFLSIAHASLAEVETHLLVAQRVGYVDRTALRPALSLCDEVSRMLTAIRARLGEPRFAVARRSPLDAPQRSPLDASPPG